MGVERDGKNTMRKNGGGVEMYGERVGGVVREE